MKVKPVIKSKALAKNELRIINIGKDAVAELLFENLMENQEKYFGVQISDNTYHCMMNWDVSNERLTYAVARIADTVNKEIDFEKLFQDVGITTGSLFPPKPFVTVSLNDFITPVCKDH